MSGRRLCKKSVRAELPAGQLLGRSRRVRLTLLCQEHQEPFLLATRASRRFHRPWVQPPTTVAAFWSLVEDCGEMRRRMLLWGAPEVPGHRSPLVGYFSLNEIVRGSLNSAYMGYWGVAGHAGQGYMTEGMKLVFRYAFTGLRLHRVEANIQPGNTASIALAERVGFRLEGFSPRYLKIGGRWRDHERWAITVEDWR